GGVADSTDRVAADHRGGLSRGGRQRPGRRVVPGSTRDASRRDHGAQERMRSMRGRAPTMGAEREAARLAIEALRAQPARTALAILGVVIGIVTVVVVASTLVGLRNSI